MVIVNYLMSGSNRLISESYMTEWITFIYNIVVKRFNNEKTTIQYTYAFVIQIQYSNATSA